MGCFLVKSGSAKAHDGYGTASAKNDLGFVQVQGEIMEIISLSACNMCVHAVGSINNEPACKTAKGILIRTKFARKENTLCGPRGKRFHLASIHKPGVAAAFKVVDTYNNPPLNATV